ncbi:unnamed protein product, partial [Mesorhabditis belari]|uniref:Uncharacterized protein n=1 Tax=Mesorhabditis belari TaxID=2138241 RepID=A0AAF3J8L2_9BILA
MKIPLVAVIFIASIAAECRPRPFGCYAWDWEEAANAGASKHAFITKAWHDKNCAESTECPSDCFLHEMKFDKSNLEEKGIQVACKISSLFCDNKEANKSNCIASREVDINSLLPRDYEDKDQLPGFKDLFLSNQMSATSTSKALEKIKAMVLPVCLNTETDVLECKKYSGKRGEICRPDQLSEEALNFKEQRFCTVLESALGGGYPELVSKETSQYAKVSNIWKFTGLPYPLIISASSNFLPGESKDGKTCTDYSMRDCRPKPLCDGDNRKVTWKELEITLENKYALEEFGPKECEISCTSTNQNHWLKAREESGLMCRILDIDGFPLYRRGRPPFARFMNATDNFNKGKFFGVSGHRNKEENSFTAYPYPLNLESIQAIEENMWLNHKTHPFAKKYGSQIKALDVPDCGEDDPDHKICNKMMGNPARLLAIILLIVLCCCLMVTGVGIVTACFIYIFKKNSTRPRKVRDAAVVEAGEKITA